MSAAGHSRARNVRFGVLIVSDAATLILSDAQQPASTLRRRPDGRLPTCGGTPFRTRDTMAVPLAPQVSPANPDRLVTGLTLPTG